MPQVNPKFSRDDRAFIEESRSAVRILNPDLGDEDFIDAVVGRLRYAQPVCEPGFADMLPPIQTPIRGLQMADTSFYYPEDRGVSESVRLAKQMADRVA
jgi:protoporphyrinogen oxidase